MKVAIHGKGFSSDTENIVIDLLARLKKEAIDLFISDKYVGILTEKGILPETYQEYSYQNNFDDVDVMITLGGDGYNC